MLQDINLGYCTIDAALFFPHIYLQCKLHGYSNRTRSSATSPRNLNHDKAQSS
jgi:hypothetical protein